MFKTIEGAADCGIRSVILFWTQGMCYQVRFITRSVKCIVTMRWVMAWLGNGFGCSMKDERTCMVRREVGIHLWWMMIWCVMSMKECVTTDVSQFLICPCSFLRFQELYCMTSSVVIWVIGNVCTMGAQDTHRGAQKKTVCCMCFDISDALSQGRRWHVEPFCDRRRDMVVPYHTWIKTAVLALEAYWLAKKDRVQADVFNNEDHVCRILGQTLCTVGRIFAPMHNNELCCLLWNAEKAEACNSKQKARNAECHHSLAPR